MANLPSAEAEDEEGYEDDSGYALLNTQGWIDIWSLLSLALIEPIGMVLWMLGQVGGSSNLMYKAKFLTGLPNSMFWTLVLVRSVEVTIQGF